MSNLEQNSVPSRRDFLKMTIFGLTGLGISACVGVEAQSKRGECVISEDSLKLQKDGLDAYEQEITADGVVDTEELEIYRREEKSYIQNRATIDSDCE